MNEYKWQLFIFIAKMAEEADDGKTREQLVAEVLELQNTLDGLYLPFYLFLILSAHESHRFCEGRQHEVKI